MDGESQQANTVILSAAPSAGNLTGVDLYEEHVNVRHENSGPITNTDLDQFDDGQDGDMLFTVTVYNTLQAEVGSELFIWNTGTFQPGGRVEVDDIDINGTFAMEANLVQVTGSWDATGGAFTGSDQVHVLRL